MFKAENADGEEFAVKISKGKNSCSFARNEYLLLKDLKHPNIPQVFGFYANEGYTKAYLVMEFLEGYTELNEYVKEKGTLPDH